MKKSVKSRKTYSSCFCFLHGVPSVFLLPIPDIFGISRRCMHMPLWNEKNVLASHLRDRVLWPPSVVASSAILIYATENCSILGAIKCHCDDFSMRQPSCWVLRKKYVKICVLFSGTPRFTISSYQKKMASSIPPRCFSQQTTMTVWSLFIHWSSLLLCNMLWAEAVNKPIHFSSMLTPRLGMEQESQLLKL